jgi:serpin B
MPVAALINALDAQYKPALLSALGAPGIGQDDINKAASRMLYDLTNLGSKDNGGEYYNPLKIANVIFVGNNVTLKKDFAQAFMDYYRGTSMNVDFSSSSAVNAVNRWASDNTDGLIKDLVKEFHPLTVAAIANSIYFSDRWSWEFSPEQTKEGVFHAPSGDTTAFYMLREGSNQIFYEDSKVKAIQLGFVNGSGMYFILPKAAGAEQLLSSFTNQYFDEIQQKSYPAEGKLLLPRFSIESSIDLIQSFKSLGIPFFEGWPFTGLIIEDDEIFLSQAIQKAIIKVDEKGTTAAAVTLLGFAGTGMPEPTKPFEMVCDRPFVFILFGNTYDGGKQILFTGIVNKPL